LREHFDRASGGCVRDEARRHHALADARANQDDPSTFVHPLEHRLGRNEGAAQVGVDHAIKLLDRVSSNFFGMAVPAC
jgi:hypothetical protein